MPAAGEEREKRPAPWVLLVVTDPGQLDLTARASEDAGYGVEIASSVQNALACLAVMTPALIVPALIVVSGKRYWPSPPGGGKAHLHRR